VPSSAAIGDGMLPDTRTSAHAARRDDHPSDGRCQLRSFGMRPIRTGTCIVPWETYPNNALNPQQIPLLRHDKTAGRSLRDDEIMEALEEPDTHLAYYLVLVTDVLGQRSRLRDLRFLPDSVEEKNAAIEILRDTAGFLMFWRKGFKDYLREWGTPTPYVEQPTSGIP